MRTSEEVKMGCQRVFLPVILSCSLSATPNKEITAMSPEEKEMINEMIANGDLIPDIEIQVCPNCQDGLYQGGVCAHCGWVP
jgi:hypothetical protein